MNWCSGRRIGMIALSMLGITYSVYHLVLEYAQDRQVMAEAQAMYRPSSEQVQENEHEQGPPQNEVQAKFKELQLISPDLAGWVRIADTNIDYPIVQGQDNEYYLYRNYKQQEMKSGSIFMDYRNKSADFDLHTVIYGHNMRDGSMFGQLKQYADAAYWQAHPTFGYETLHDNYVAEVFAVYYTTTEEDYIQTDFSGKDEYEAFVNNVRERSLYQTDTVVTADSQILTLSTCDSTLDPEVGRLAVHAKLTKK